MTVKKLSGFPLSHEVAVGGVGVLSNPKFAVLLAAYNGCSWLGEQVSSILRQKDVDVTLYVSVDRSSDGTEVLVDSLARGDDRIVILPHGQRFGGAAKNFYRLLRDVDTSLFDFISFADQDDIWNLDKLANAADLIVSSSADAYSSNVTAFWADGRRKLIVKSQKQVKYDYLFEAAGPGCTYVFRRALAQSIRREVIENWDKLQEVTLHDWYCYALARASGARWLIDPRPSMLYRQHENNQVGINSGFPAFKRRVSQVTSGWWLTQSRLIAGLVGMSGDPFVDSWLELKRIGHIRLALNSLNCRRRVRDKLAFSFFCVMLSILPRKREQ